MISILFQSILLGLMLLLAAIALAYTAHRFFKWDDSGIFTVIPMILAMLMLVLTIVVPIGWYSASKTAEVFNETFATEYTAKDFFFTKIATETIVEIKMELLHEY